MPAPTNPRAAGTMLDDKMIDWTVQWRVEGRTEGQAAPMRRLAARKFGPETAERVAGCLAALADPERAGEIGEWLLECESGEELLGRVEGLCESSVAGDGAPLG